MLVQNSADPSIFYDPKSQDYFFERPNLCYLSRGLKEFFDVPDEIPWYLVVFWSSLLIGLLLFWLLL